MRRLTGGRAGRRRAVAMVVAAVVAAGTVVGVAVARGAPARLVSLQDGSVWLVSSKVGQAALVDGASSQVVTQVKVAGADADLSSAQTDADAFVADGARGSLVRVDGATYDVSDPAPLARPGQRLTVFPGGDEVFAFAEPSGSVTTADAHTLRVLGQQTLVPRIGPGGGVVDGDGRLWLVDSTNGTLAWRERDGTVDSRRAAVDPAAQLVAAGGQAAVIEGASVRPIEPGGALGLETCLAEGADDATSAVAGSPVSSRVYTVSGRRGALLVSDLKRRSCDVIVELGAAGNELGAPSEAAGRVFVPDFTTGEVYIVDLAHPRTVPRVKVLPGGSPFELVPGGGFMFYNDPASEHAGVVRLDGPPVEIRKYDPANPGGGLAEGSGSGGGSGDGSGTGSGDGSGTGRGDGSGGQEPTTGPTSPPPTTGPTGQQRGGSVAIELSDGEVTVGESVTARVRVSDGGRLSSVLWTFGDGSRGSGSEVRHSWARPGTYSVSAKVTLADGRGAEPSAQVTVTGQSTDDDTDPEDQGQQGQGGDDQNQGGDDRGQGGGDQNQGGDDRGQGGEGQGPTARLTLSYKAGSGGVSTLDVTANASASIAGSSPIVSYEFDFTGSYGATQTESSATHTYDSERGGRTVRVRVRDADNRQSEASATVDAQTARLEVTVQGAGRVSGPEELFCPDVCGATLLVGQQVTLSAAATGGAGFGGWSGACDGSTSTTCTFVLNGDRTVAAAFSESTPATLTVRISGPGNVTAQGQTLCSDVAAPCDWQFPSGSTANIHAEVDDSLYPPAHFVGWQGVAGCGTSPDCAVTMDGARQAEAVFEQETRPPQITGITATPNQGAVSCPVTVTFRATIHAANAGTVRYRWLRSDGATDTNNSSVTFNGAGSQEVTDTWTLTPTPGGQYWEQLEITEPGGVSPSGQATFSLTCA